MRKFFVETTSQIIIETRDPIPDLTEATMQPNPTMPPTHAPEPLTIQTRRDIIASVRKAAAEKLAGMPQAANSHDFLYDENGLPG